MEREAERWGRNEVKQATNITHQVSERPSDTLSGKSSFLLDGTEGTQN